MVLGDHIAKRIRVLWALISMAVGIFSGAATMMTWHLYVRLTGEVIGVDFWQLFATSVLPWVTVLTVLSDRMVGELLAAGSTPQQIGAKTGRRLLIVLVLLTGFCVGPYLGGVVMLLLRAFFDVPHSFSLQGALAIFTGVLLSLAGYSLRHHPSISASFVGIGIALYAGPWSAEVAVRHWPIGGSDEEASFLRSASLAFTIAWSTFLCALGYSVGRWLRH